MLDNPVVLWVSEFSDSNGHRADDLLWLLMGNAAFGITDAKFGNPTYCDGAIPSLIA